ncbi:ribitol 5-phosphate transferase FKRP-like [Corticium candelabrum]|uniref:ribitol 5-phosphate transferase FKRP-like n=1 Tax=Corticium candelabrum TaxID=121492 RepID=UPI002E27209C|nr:ribitol 5-phosphate transferase FKRP-like [Corticium candelabrum]
MDMPKRSDRLIRSGSIARILCCIVFSCLVVECLLRYQQIEGAHVWTIPQSLYRYFRLNEPCYPQNQDQRIRDLRQLLFHFVDVAETVNMRYWIDFGSLLGAVRNGKIIPWDWDVDIGVLKSEMEAPQVRSLLEKRGVQVVRRTGCKFFIRFADSEAFLDACMHWIRGGQVLRCELTDVFRYQFPVKWISPTVPIMFEGRQVQAPNPPMEILKQARYPYTYWWTMPQNFYCYFTEFRLFLKLLALIGIVVLPSLYIVTCCCKRLFI